VRLKPNKTYKYGFQVAPSVVFFQKNSAEWLLKEIQNRSGYGYLRYRNDGMIELTIGDRPSIKKILQEILPFLIGKQKQAQLMLKVLDDSKQIASADDFLALAKLIDQFGELNYSKKRKIHTQVVYDYLISKGILTP
jgi:hypothetical protein